VPTDFVLNVKNVGIDWNVKAALKNWSVDATCRWKTKLSSESFTLSLSVCEGYTCIIEVFTGKYVS